MKSIKVILWGREIGLLSENPSNENYYLFRYNKDFVQSNMQICPLLMPLNNNTYEFNELDRETFKGLPPLIVDSLPDRYGETLLSVWMKNHNKSELDPLDVLSYIGKRGMGALEYEPALDKNDKLENIDIESLVAVAKKVLSSRENVNFNINDQSDLTKLIDVGSSIGGARAKAIIAMNDKGDIKSGQIANLKGYKYYILKFDGLSSDLSEDKEITYYTRIEYSYYLMAKSCGIKMNECFLYKKNERYHFVTRRFDRDENGEKIHMLSLAGMLGYDYKKPGENSYEDVARLLHRLKCDINDVYQLFKRMVFNVLARNNDDHIKNISFLMDKNGIWKLAPAYDLSFSYNPNGIWTRHHQMRINNKVDDITYNDLLTSGLNMGIKQIKVIELIEEVKKAIEKYDEFAKEANIPNSEAEIIKSLFPKIQ